MKQQSTPVQAQKDACSQGELPPRPLQPLRQALLLLLLLQFACLCCLLRLRARRDEIAA